MAIIYVKPWPPVKPMDPAWLEEYGKLAPHISGADNLRIQRALTEYSERSNASAEALNDVLLEIVPMPPLKGEQK